MTIAIAGFGFVTGTLLRFRHEPRALFSRFRAVPRHSTDVAYSSRNSRIGAESCVFAPWILRSGAIVPLRVAILS
jgi:hypothetical protein